MAHRPIMKISLCSARSPAGSSQQHATTFKKPVRPCGICRKYAEKIGRFRVGRSVYDETFRPKLQLGWREDFRNRPFQTGRNSQCHK